MLLSLVTKVARLSSLRTARTLSTTVVPAASAPPLNPLAEELEGSGIRKIMARAWELQESLPNDRVIRLEVGQPNFPSPPHVIDATIEALHDLKNQAYIQSTGLPELREAVARRYSERHHVETVPSQILATHGAMFGMATALMATIGSGDEVLVPDPGFPNYVEAVHMMSGKAVPYPCRPQNGFLPDVAEIAERISPRTKMVVLMSPGNPTGAVMPLDLLEQIQQLALDRNVYILSDEIYGDLNFSTEEPAPSILDARNFDDTRTMVISGVSKAYAMTGFRVGWLRASEKIIDIGSKLHEPFISCGVPFAQRGALAALQGPSNSTEFMRAAYRRRRDTALDILEAHSLRSYTPEGAFYVLVRCGGDSMQFATQFLVDEMVAVAPGSAFGSESEGYVRVSFASSDEDVAEGVTRLCRYIANHKG
eukprot:m.255783 g.255783  ORF g.255783 m.255783 type:complete len:423 (+) comp15948_c0_seq6:5940-7208(+)